MYKFDIKVSIIKFHHIYKTYIIPKKIRYSQSTFMILII